MWLESEPIDLTAAFSRCSRDDAFVNTGRVAVPQNTGIGTDELIAALRKWGAATLPASSAATT